MKNNIIKIMLEIVCLCGLYFIVSRGSIAFFSDTESVEVTMTAGNVDIQLSEAAVKADAAGNLVVDPDAPRINGTESVVLRNYGKIYPGQSIYKDPTIENVGVNEAWIAAKITVTDGSRDISKVMGYPGFHAIDIEQLLSGGLLDEKVHVGTWNGFENVCYNDRYAMVQIVDPTKDAYEFYFFILDKQYPGDVVQIFETMQVPAEWTNSEMQELAELTIKVQAFGVQTFSFDSCYAAMVGAFADYFP